MLFGAFDVFGVDPFGVILLPMLPLPVGVPAGVPAGVATVDFVVVVERSPPLSFRFKDCMCGVEKG